MKPSFRIYHLRCSAEEWQGLNSCHY